MARLPLDLHQSLSRLHRDKAFTLVTVLTLALGIGANTAAFSVLRAVLLEPLPYPDPARLAVIWGPDRAETTWLSLQEVAAYGRESRALTGVAGYREMDATLTGGQEPERIRAAATTATLFETLGVAPAIGRWVPSAELASAPDVIVLGHGLWQRRFGGNPAVIGLTIQVNGAPRTVTGVMPPDFRLPTDYGAQRPTEAWLPEPPTPDLGAWGNRSYIGVARASTAVKDDLLSRELASIAQGWVNAGYVQARPDGSLGALARSAVPVTTFVTGQAEQPLAVLLAAVALVLLIACANVANLQLARAAVRERELSVRAALGASRARIIRQLLTESVVVALAGGVAGLAVAWAGLQVVVAMRPADLPRLDNVSLDGGVLAVTALLAVLTGLAFGLVPALQLSKTDVAGVLNDGSRGATLGRSGRVTRRALVVLQVASSVVLALAAGLLIRSLVEMQRIDLGFEPHGVLTADLQVPATDYPRPEDIVRFYRDVGERVAALPGVRAAGAVRVLPLSRSIGDWSIRIEGQPYVAAENPNADYQAVTPGYFEAMGLRLARGRFLTARDREGTLPVAVINETMAERYWPGEDAIGRQFMMGTDDKPWLTIVGIVRAVRHNAVIEEPRAEMYVAHAQLPEHIRSAPRGMTLTIRTEGDPLALVPAVRDAVHAVDANLPVSGLRTMEAVTAQALSQPRFITWLLLAFAAAAMVLAAVGLYGTISLLVSERTRELGIRLALGAGRRAVMRLVLSEGVRLTAVGVGLGLAGAAALTRTLGSLVYGIGVLDPVTFLLAPAALAAVALLACLLPAVRAATIPPAVTLK